jgi:hypothetical protein
MNYVWILPLILICSLGAYCSKLSNDKVPYGATYVFLVSIFCALVWVWVSKVSKNLLMDSVIFDVVVCVVYAGAYAYLGFASGFTWYNWAGLFAAMVGLVMMKL